MRYVALLGEFTPTFKPHVATNAAIKHTCAALDLSVDGEWVSTQDIGHSLFSRYSGIWVAPGSPYKNLERTLWAIEHARTNNIPCFGTCGGFQHMVLEYARNVLHFSDAQHAEYDPYASTLFITQLACSLAGREMTLEFVPGSMVAEIYGAMSAKEEYYCNFGVDPRRVQLLTSGVLRVTGSDSEGEIRVIELPEHPFFVGTLYVPQTRSTQATPHLLVNAFLTAISRSVGPPGEPRSLGAKRWIMEIVQRLENTKAQTLKFFELTDEELDKSYEPGKWTVRYILHHLADAETVLFERIRRVISEPRQVLWAFDQDAWARKLDYANMPLELSKHIYASVREGIIHNVRLHYDSSGQLEFVHSETGVRTLKDEFDKVASHNEHHLEQIRRALGIS